MALVSRWMIFQLIVLIFCVIAWIWMSYEDFRSSLTASLKRQMFTIGIGMFGRVPFDIYLAWLKDQYQRKKILKEALTISLTYLKKDPDTGEEELQIRTMKEGNVKSIFSGNEFVISNLKKRE